MEIRPEAPRGAPLDALVVGGGPAGLTAALYLARFRRRFLVVDAGAPRARWIPTSHNIPFFAEGIGGPEILARMRASLAPYDAPVLAGEVVSLDREGEGFAAEVARRDGRRQRLFARHALLATGSEDVEPPLPDVAGAVREGLVRHCPICDGYESRERRIGVIGVGARGAAEAIFVARTYSDDVTLLTLGAPMDDLDEATRAKLAELRVRIAERPVLALEREGDGGRIAAIRAAGGETLRFDVLYSALGLRYRNALARGLGAELDGRGAVVVGEGGETRVPGLYALGDVAAGLDQIAVAMGQAAVATTRVHNRCGPRTTEEG
jgi:thioredoxin reductase (NADPH)